MTVRTLLDLHTTEADGGAVVRVVGEVDLSTAGDLRQRLVDLCERGVHDIDIDLSETTFMDSTGLSVLLGALRRCRRGGGHLTLQHPSRPVLNLLHATRLTLVFSDRTMPLSQLPATTDAER